MIFQDRQQILRASTMDFQTFKALSTHNSTLFKFLHKLDGQLLLSIMPTEQDPVGLLLWYSLCFVT